jgi:hypothetical protein
MKAIKAVYNLLINDVDTAAAVTNRIYPVRVPQGLTFPAIVLTQITREANETKTGYSITDVARVQVTILADTATEAMTIAELVREAMSPVLPAIYNTIYLSNIAFLDEQILIDDDGDELGVFYIAQDYNVHFNNAIVSTGNLLLEDGGFMLLENGDKIIL